MTGESGLAVSGGRLNIQNNLEPKECYYAKKKYCKLLVENEMSSIHIYFILT